MRGAASNMKRISLELGGKSPFMVFDDADIEKALGLGHLFGFLNSGQFCGMASRFIVQEGVYDRFVEAMTERARATPVGEWHEENVFMGPLIS